MIDILKYIKFGETEYPMAFTLNVMESIQDKYGSMEAWGKAMKPDGKEPQAKDIKWTFTQFINEGIDIENEKKNEKRDFVTEKQAGRIISSVGMTNVSGLIQDLTVRSVKTDDEKN